MTLTNRDVFVVDPTDGDIPNLGVSKVRNPQDDSDWKTLEWELRNFVCEGEYERSLERILDQFLSHLGQDEQPAAWVSGFFGSGKSHLMRVLEYLWRDYQLPSGAAARDLAQLTPEIERHLAELSAAAKRAGGLWSAAGKLGSGVSTSVRLAFLSIVFDAAGLPQGYAEAQLAIFLKNEGLYDQVHDAVGAVGKSFEHEVRRMWVSPVLAQALLDAGAQLGADTGQVMARLEAQFPPNTADISNDEMLNTFEEVLKLQSTAEGKLPLTLIVLDEMQQFINDDGKVAENVQYLVEGCSSRFGSQVLVVATGQGALTTTNTLRKLMGRFTVNAALLNTDVETVVRKVVLRKKPDAVAANEAALAKESGEIDRHLGGTRLEAKAADKSALIADYPLLPTRRRFWEHVLHAIDTAGEGQMLRNQLKVVHEAARSIADEPLGHVIGGDFIFTSSSADMLSSGVLLREIDELIRGLQDGTADGELKSRACALIFLISKLPHDGVGDTGVRATHETLEDLLVENLSSDGTTIRRDVPGALDDLVEQGRVIKLGDEFRLQTEEGATWTQDFNRRRAQIRDDAARMAQLRNDWIIETVDAELDGINRNFVHGVSKTPRKFDRHWGDNEPVADGTSIPIWIRNEWSTTASKAKESASKAGDESPVVFVLLPKVDAETIRDTLATHAAASETIEQRSEPQTPEGRQAKQGMRSRQEESRQRLTSLFGTVVAKARVFQGGGNELTTSTLRAGVEVAGQHALTRQFSKFGTADHANWGKVKDKAREGAPDSLSHVSWPGEVPANPVCKEVLARTAGSGTKGSEIQRELDDPPYGWPKDAIDGALLALFANGNIRAERDGQPLAGPKELPATQIGKATFFKEDEPPSATERMAVRGVLTEAKVPYDAGQEAVSISGLIQHLTDLAARAGGPAPLPEPPDTSHVAALNAVAGNQQFRAVALAAEQLRQDIKLWTAAADQREARLSDWSKLDRLLDHANELDETVAVRTQRDAVVSSRLLLDDPDPVAPLIDQLCTSLRTAIGVAWDDVQAGFGMAVGDLEASDGWAQLDDQQRLDVLTDAGLVTPDQPDVSSNDALLATLGAQPLSGLRERIHVLPAKVVAARRAIAKIVDPEPTIATVKPASATLKSPADVDIYLATLRTELMEHINAGETVIT